MNAIGLTLAIIGQARTVLISIKARIDNYRDSPEAFRTLCESVDRLNRHITDVEVLLRTNPNALETKVALICKETFEGVRDCLEKSNQTIELALAKSFSPSSTSVVEKILSRGRRTIRASKLKSKMDTVETHIKESANQLLQLCLTHGIAVKMQEHCDELVSKLDNLSLVDTSKDVYYCRSNVPAFTDNMYLNYHSTDTPEGDLKQKIMSSNSSSNVTVAAGVIAPAYGIVGMAGVGKTVALQGLVHDKDIRERFPHGVFFVTLGQGAAMETVLGGLARIMVITGSQSIAAQVQSSTSILEAVEYAIPRLQGKDFLFLVDDVWPTKNLKAGYLKDLRQLLRESPDSRMAISTRSTDIAKCAGSVVNFGPRDPLGVASVKIFLAHATDDYARVIAECRDGNLRDSVHKILTICAGLPIALAVTGSAVAHLTNLFGDFGTACDKYVIRLAKKRNGPGDEDTEQGPSLNASILLSLDFLQAEYVNWKSKCNMHLHHTITDMYTSLCVLQNQDCVPASVLGRLWKIDESDAGDILDLFCGMSLATLQLRQSSNGSSEVAGIVLHDLQLDFCRRRAIQDNKLSLWHTQLLDGYLKSSDSPMAGEQFGQEITGIIPRAWWSNALPDDDYIHGNLARHLLEAEQGHELAALLLDARWTDLRRNNGGILALETDFQLLQSFLMKKDVSAGHKYIGVEVDRCFQQIFNACRLAWGRKDEGLRTYHFYVLARLAGVRASSAVLDVYWKSVERNTPKPCVVPVNSFLPESSSAQILEVIVEGECRCVAWSPCGQYIAAGAGSDVVVLDAKTGERIMRMKDHSKTVDVVVFTDRSKNIVSVDEATVMIWDWETPYSSGQVLQWPERRESNDSLRVYGNRYFWAHGPRLTIWNKTTVVACKRKRSSKKVP